MIRSVYQTSMSMLVHQKKQEGHANNLANVETAGYKTQALVTEAAFSEVFVNHASENGSGAVVLGSMPMGVRVAGMETNWAQGALVETGRAMDLALEGPGFLAFESPQGLVYARNGALHQNQGGEWVDPSGFRLMARSLEGGLEAIRSLPGEALTVSASGELFDEGGAVLGRLPVYGVPEGLEEEIEHLDGGYVRPQPGSLVEMAGTRLRQGMTESSNVDSTSSLIDMMSTGRLLQTQQRVLSTLDETLNRAVNEIGKV